MAPVFSLCREQHVTNDVNALQINVQKITRQLKMLHYAYRQPRYRAITAHLSLQQKKLSCRYPRPAPAEQAGGQRPSSHKLHRKSDSPPQPTSPLTQPCKLQFEAPPRQFCWIRLRLLSSSLPTWKFASTNPARKPVFSIKFSVLI